MADKKISQLTGATTPLAGTEVLPVVQSSATVKVSVANLTAGRAVSAQSVATTGASAIGTSIDSSVGFLIVDASNASYTITARGNDQSSARIRIKNTASGGGDYAFIAGENNVGQTGLTLLSVGGATLWALDDGSGNIAQKVAAKGVNFTANTGAAGMTSQLLNWYEEGTWTPTDASGASLSFTVSSAQYTRIGRQVTISFDITYPSTASTATQLMGGLPFVANSAIFGGAVTYFNGPNPFSIMLYTSGGVSYISLRQMDNSGTNRNNAYFSTYVIRGVATYFV